MKVLLIGNYLHSRQQSMQRFAAMVQGALQEAGHDVRVLRPRPIFGLLRPAEDGIGKWLGYIDRFCLFRFRLSKAVGSADVVHICDQASAVYVPLLAAKPHVVTCHDMLAIRSALGDIPQRRTRWSGRLLQRWIVRGLRRARFVVCASDETRIELLRIVSLPRERVSVVHNALNYPYSPMHLEEAIGYLQHHGKADPRPFFLHVGGNQWYKNRLGVLRIFQHLSALPGFGLHSLIMAGKPWPPEMHRFVRENNLSDRVQELTNVPNESLRALYSLADTLIFPSLQEGFGWPIIEAQACGCPVATSNRAPMTQVGGEGAVYMDPGDEIASAAAIARMQHRRKELVQAGLINAKRFSRAAMLDGYLHAYHAALTASGGTQGFPGKDDSEIIR